MKNNSRAKSEFRNDINGLRAWAVVAVILYHFGIPGFGGGFVGVDVFFVISGFLMTGIVVGGLERGASKFSLIGFYMARARRILPALIVLCAVLLILGWCMLAPPDYRILGAHTVFSLVFLSNIKFWTEAGYFDAASHEKWLLHTWSLAVEWQFYLLLPLVLLTLWKLRPGRQPVIVAMAAGLLISIALSVLITPQHSSFAFYLLPTRAWEMLAGGLVYLLAHCCQLTERRRVVLEAVGFALMIASIVVFDTSSPWPGWRALVPVVGTVAVLLAARSGSSWTGHTAVQWLGTRSYSLYLWHWPIVVSLTFLEWQGESKAIAGGLLLTLVLGHLSYLLVESPVRVHFGKLRLSWGIIALLGALMVVVVPGLSIRLLDGVAGRFSAAIELIASEVNNINPRSAECVTIDSANIRSCMYGGANLRAILLGDSHANAMVTALAAALQDERDGIMEWAQDGCPILLGAIYLDSAPGASQSCSIFLSGVVQKLVHVRRDVPLVIINRSSVYALGHDDLPGPNIPVPLVYFDKKYASSSSEYLTAFAARLTDSACRLAKDRPVYLMRPVPEIRYNVPKILARAMLFNKNQDVSISLIDYHKRNSVVWAAQDVARARCGVKILDPLPYLCRDGRCHGSKEGRSLYVDDNHLSEYGNKLLVPMFRKVFETDQTQIKSGLQKPYL